MRIAAMVGCVMLLAGSLGAQRPREQFTNATVSYGWVTTPAGDKLRTFVTRPKNAMGKVPAIFVVGWLSCDSVEYPEGDRLDDGFGILLHRLIEDSSFATVRVDKAGVGESTGTSCGQLDFQREMQGYQAAFAAMKDYGFIDPDRVFVVGLSNGGGVGPLAAAGHGVRGYVAASSWGRTWYEHMLEMERRRLTSAHKSSPAEINAAMKGYAEFYDLYLGHGMTPREVLAAHPEWKPLWYDAPDGQYGRPAAFYQQLQALNLGEVWQKVGVPVLVVHGTADTIMSRNDSMAIADSVNATHPGQARYLEMDGMSHGFMAGGKFDEAVARQIIDWMKEQVAAGRQATRSGDPQIADF